MTPRTTMNRSTRLLVVGLLLTTCLLPGCVAFEQIPAPLACDARLAGRWMPVAAVDKSDIDGVVIDRNCQALFPPPDRNTRESYRMTLRGFVLDEWHYLVFNAHDVERIYGLEADALAPLDGASFLLRYRIDGNALQGWVVDSDAALQAAASDRIDLRTVERDLHLVTGDAPSTAHILRSQPELFEDSSDAPAVQLRRVSGEAQ